MNIFSKIMASLRFAEAIRKAEDAHMATGERYYVIPAGNNTAKLVVMDRNNFRRLKFKGYMRRNWRVRDLEKECFYCTPYKNGKDGLPYSLIPIKRKQYYSWVESIKKIRKTKRRKQKNNKKDEK